MHVVSTHAYINALSECLTATPIFQNMLSQIIMCSLHSRHKLAGKRIASNNKRPRNARNRTHPYPHNTHIILKPSACALQEHVSRSDQQRRSHCQVLELWNTQGNGVPGGPRRARMPHCIPPLRKSELRIPAPFSVHGYLDTCSPLLCVFRPSSVRV